MRRKDIHSSSSLTTLKKQKPKRFLTKRILSLFIIMIIGVAIFFYLFTLYHDIGEAYRTSVEDVSLKETDTPIDSPINHHETVTFLIVGVDYGHAGRLDEKRANVITTLTINPSKKQSIQVNVSRLLKDTQQDVTLSHVYKNGNVMEIKQSVEELLQIPIHHTVKVELSELRPLLDQLGGLKVKIESPIQIGDQTYAANQEVQMSSREVMLYMQAQTDESEWEHSKRETQVLEQISIALFDKFSNVSRITELAATLNEAESWLITDLEYETFFNFIRENYIKNLDQRSVISLRGDYQADESPWEKINEQWLDRTRSDLQELVGQ